jgi:hypothetical protein
MHAGRSAVARKGTSIMASRHVTATCRKAWLIAETAEALWHWGGKENGKPRTD